MGEKKKTETSKPKKEEAKPLNLYEKIQAVSNEVRNIEKNLQVGTGSYAYKAVGDNDVTLAVKDAETKFRLVSIPIKQKLISSEALRTTKGNTETIKFVDNIKMTVRIIDLDDPKQFLDVQSYGKGIDTADKGFGKASTYARKYALLNAYKIATGEDPDANKSEETAVPKTVDEKRKTVVDFLNLDNDRLVKTLAHYSIATADEFTNEQIEEMYKTLKAKKQI